MLLSRYKNGLMVALGVGVISLLPLYYAVWWGFCQGWLLGGSYLLRSAWLCSCPIPKETEQTFYPDHIEVVFSACDNVEISSVLNSQYILVKNDPQEKYTYLLEPISQKKISLEYYYRGTFLTPETVYYYDDNRQIWVSHLPTNTKIPIIYLALGLDTKPNQLEASLTQYLYSPEYIIYLSNYENNYRDIIFIPQVFPQSVELNAQIVSVEKNTVLDLEIEEFIKTHEINKFSRGFDNIFDLKSPNEQYIAKTHGIYDLVTDELIADASPISTSSGVNSGCAPLIPWCQPLYTPCCWQADNQAVFYFFGSGNMGVTPYSIGAPWGFNGEVVTPIFRVHLPSSTP